MKNQTFTQFMSNLTKELQREQRDGTAHVCQSTLNRIRGFTRGRELSFCQVNAEWLIRFQNHLIADQLKWNTISTYMRMLRSVYNKAADCGIAPHKPRLFSKVHTGVDSPVKRAIKPETLRRLIADDNSVSEKYAFYCDVFILLFLLRGMSFVDLAYLRRCDFDGGTLTYRRHKTGREVKVQVGEEARRILMKHINKDRDAYYLLPIIKNPGTDEYRQYANMLRITNYRLMQLGRELRLPERITTYTARHTWATTALRRNFNTGLICDAMGHSSVKVTETYFKRFRDEEINRMNSSIVSYIFSMKQK